jgi:hypothetical protein
MARTEMLIPIEEVAGRAGHGPAGIQGWASRLGIKLERDWAARECVPESGASQIVEEIRTAGREAAELHQAYEHSQDWQRRQHEAGESAFQDFLGAALDQQRTSRRPVYTQGNQAAAEAREAFAQHERKLSFDEFKRKRSKGRKR